MANTIEWTPITAIQYALWTSGEKQRDLADKLGWSEARLSKIISGKQRLLVDDLAAIAKAQGKDYNWYLDPPAMSGAMGVYLRSLIGTAA
jgi:antitoxin component HigA of HigAB toxin-antitoxin module